jgi:hypothetical protein
LAKKDSPPLKEEVANTFPSGFGVANAIEMLSNSNESLLYPNLKDLVAIYHWFRGQPYDIKRCISKYSKDMNVIQAHRSKLHKVAI